MRALAFERLSPTLAPAHYPELHSAYENMRFAEASPAACFSDNPKARDHFVEQARIEIVRKLDSVQVPQLQRAGPRLAVQQKRARKIRLALR